MVRHLPTLSIAMSVTSLALLLAQPAAAETVTLGIGTQDTTTNTVTAGVVIRQLHLLEKYLPKDGKYANIKFELEWQNFTSGPPVTNAMMANKLQIGMMGDYPLIVNGFTFDSNPESKSRLIGIAAYSLSGSGNGMVVQRGLRQAASYHNDRLRQEKAGYFYDVITNGFGAMQGYAEQIPVRDRWLIVAYVRTLQLSQHASVQDVPVDRRGALDGAAPEAPQGNTVKPVEKR